MNRVGQEYGHAAEQKEPANKQPKKQEEGGGIQSHAAKASDEALKRAAADENAKPEVREAAKKELDKFVDSSNYMKKSGLEEQLNDATPEELKYIMVRAIEDKISSSKSGNMEGINHIIQEGIHKIKDNNDLGDDYMISWNMLLD